MKIVLSLMLLVLFVSCNPMIGKFEVMKKFTYLEETTSWDGSVVTTENEVEPGSYEGKVTYYNKDQIHFQYGKNKKIVVELNDDVGNLFPQYSGSFSVLQGQHNQPFGLVGDVKYESWITNEFERYDQCIVRYQHHTVCHTGPNGMPVCQTHSYPVYGRQLVRHYDRNSKQDMLLNIITDPATNSVAATFAGTRSESVHNAVPMSACW